jgi:nuclear RNA export factor
MIRAQNAGWPAVIISDTLTVHNYYGTGAFIEPTRSLALEGVTIQAPGAPAGGDQDVLLNQVRQRTGMNAQYASMCLAQNGWDLETAVRNYEEIKGSIPAEAYQ